MTHTCRLPVTAAGRPPISTVATATAPGGGVPMTPPWAVLSPVRAAGGMVSSPCCDGTSVAVERHGPGYGPQLIRMSLALSTASRPPSTVTPVLPLTVTERPFTLTSPVPASRVIPDELRVTEL